MGKLKAEIKSIYRHLHQPSYIVLGSTAGAAEYQRDSLGEFVKQLDDHNGRVFYKQRHTEGNRTSYLYYNRYCNRWCVGDTLDGRYACKLENKQNTELPPTTGWKYSDGSNMCDNDPTLVLEYIYI